MKDNAITKGQKDKQVEVGGICVISTRPSFVLVKVKINSLNKDKNLSVIMKARKYQRSCTIINLY
jgi:hypothetical protein